MFTGGNKKKSILQNHLALAQDNRKWSIEWVATSQNISIYKKLKIRNTSCSHRCSDLCPCIQPCAKSVRINFHTLSHTGSHRCVLLPRRTACLCAFMAVSSDVSQPSVTQSSGFSLFVPFNSLQCTDVTEQPGEQETEAKWHRENPARVKGIQELTHSPCGWWRRLACAPIIKGNLVTLRPLGSPGNRVPWKSGNTTDGNKDFQEMPMLC